VPSFPKLKEKQTFLNPVFHTVATMHITEMWNTVFAKDVTPTSLKLKTWNLVN
jgi:hypothetical protein